MTKIYGSHTFKTGFQVDDFHAPIIQPTYGKGNFGFTGQFSDIPNQNSGYEGVGDMLLVPALRQFPAESTMSAACRLTDFPTMPR